MGAAAVRAAKAFDYTNAGTVEFILDESGHFYFLEVNTRLQVEHPVTEMVVHHDLVRAQIEVAAGRPLPFAQDDLRQDGHAMECRIYAEDPSHDFRPSIGTREHYQPPVGPNIRVDSGVEEGSEVTPYYDAMLAKLIVSGRSREESLQRMSWALRNYVVMGVATNIEFLQALLDHAEFRAGRLHTHFLKDHAIQASAEDKTSREVLACAAYSVQAGAANDSRGMTNRRSTVRAASSPWQGLSSWRNA
jgi:acetyl/propionyl-CoA carboxylase alpha subunit